MTNEMSSEIIRKNLQKMLGESRGDMQHLIKRESIGGNAGEYEINGQTYPCVGANFYYKPNGEITLFSNYYPRQDDVAKDLFSGTFRIAVDYWRVPSFFKIVDTYLSQGTQKDAKNLIEESAKLYNKKMDEIGEPNECIKRFLDWLSLFL